jgi:hypothetical protein
MLSDFSQDLNEKEAKQLAKIEITKTELVWPGKQLDRCARSLSASRCTLFQVVIKGGLEALCSRFVYLFMKAPAPAYRGGG